MGNTLQNIEENAPSNDWTRITHIKITANLLGQKSPEVNKRFLKRSKRMTPLVVHPLGLEVPRHTRFPRSSASIWVPESTGSCGGLVLFWRLSFELNKQSKKPIFLVVVVLMMGPLVVCVLFLKWKHFWYINYAQSPAKWDYWEPTHCCSNHKST